MEDEPAAEPAALDSKNEEETITETPSEPEETKCPILENGDVPEETLNENSVDKESESLEELVVNNEDQLEEEEAEEKKVALKREAESEDSEPVPKKKSKKSNSLVNGDVKEEYIDEPDDDIESESDEEVSKPRRRGRCKKNPEQIPAHLAPDIALGYRMLLKFLETPQFSGFLRPGQVDAPAREDNDSEPITCLNQIKKKFDDNSYKRIEDFVTDVREMLSSIYTSQGNPVAVKRALRLEQVLEQRIAQLPNYLRPQCALVLSSDEISNSPKKIRINKGGGFVSLLLERAEKIRAEKDREKRKVLAEERKQLKEEQDKDVQDWEKNVLLKDHEEEMKSMWELPQIGHFIHICANILNVGDVSQYEVERMLLMPQCSETLDLLVTALLSNTLVRAKLDRTPSMPYSIWLPQIRARVTAWYRAYHREYNNAQKVFEEIGVEPDFFDVCGKLHSPLDYYGFHEIPLIQRVWILKTLCDVDFIRKKTVYENIRNQLLEELQGTNLGVDRHGNRYIHFPQFGMTAIRIYRQATIIGEGINPSDLVESQEGFEERKGEITLDKVFRDIWDVGKKEESSVKKAKKKKKRQRENVAMKVKIEPTGPKNLRQSARVKRKVYVDSTDSDGSDTDLATLKSKLDDQNKTQNTPISLTVFRLPREKVKPINVKKSYYSRKLEREEAERQRQEEEKGTKEKLSPEDEDASVSMEPRMDDDEDDDTKENFTIKNLENLKMVLKKDTEDDNARDGMIKEEDKFKYNTPAHLLPDRSKFYCVVDSVDGLRQLISHFASDDNDLEIINRSTLRSGRKTGSKLPESPSCEVQLIERLQNLVESLELWENDFIKTSRTIRDKLYKEYTNFMNRPADFVHPNEAYWQTLYEEPPPLPQPEPAEPEPKPLDQSAAEQITPSTTAPLSPLGSLRPRTRTRQQVQPVVKTEDPEIDEEYQEEQVESSESDDVWEMPVSRKRNRRPPERTPVTTPRQSKRLPKRNVRYSPGSSDSGKKPLFWASQCSDPSEELNWEANRQKILERHNSPRKGTPGESDTTEDENSQRNTTLQTPTKNRPQSVPGNKKPYYSAAQLSAMNKKKDNLVATNAARPSPSLKATPRQTASQRSGKPLFKKQILSQLNVAVAKSKPAPSPVVITPQEEYYITDGTAYIKIESSLVAELLKKHENIQQFRGRLDLSKKIEIVKKKVDTVVSSPSITSESQTDQTAQTPSPKTSNLRFIRPQLVPNQVQYIRSQQRLPSQQPNIVYVQATQQVPTTVRPAGLVQMIARPAVSQVATSGTVVFQQSKPEEPNANPVDIVGLIPSGSPSAQMGFIQVPSGAKQPIQFVQLSQPSTQTASPAQNVYRIASSSSADTQTSPSYVRVASTGQILQLAQASFKPQTTVAAVAQPTSNQVNLVQVQGLPGEPVSYIPLPAGLKPMGNIIRLHAPVNSGAFMQVSPPGRQPAPVQRLVPVQPRTPGLVVQNPRPQMVQVSVQRTAATAASVRPHLVPITTKPQTTVVQMYATPRVQTTMAGNARPQMVQVRPQEAGKAVTPPRFRPAGTTAAVTTSSTTILQTALRQTSPRGATVPVGQRLQVAQGVVPRPVGAVGTSPASDVAAATQNRLQRPMRVQGPLKAPVTIRQTLRAPSPATPNSTRPITAQVVQMPLVDGKPGFYQLQNAAGQTMNIVQMVSSEQSTNTPSSSLSVQTSTISQGKQQTPALSQGNVIQIQPSSGNSPGSGMVQLQGHHRPQLVQLSGNTLRSAVPSLSPKQPAVYSIHMPDVEESSGKSPSPATMRVITSSGQTLRLVTTDNKPGQTVALQPMLVRPSGNKPVVTTGNKVLSGQGVTLESEEVRKESSPVLDTVDIIRGEMSVRNTEDGAQFVVKTAMGQDYVLNNSQIEARKAANNGRMV